MTPLGLIPYVIDRIYYRRFGSSAWLTFVYPVAATAMDFFSSNGSPFGSFGAVAYSQRDFLAAMQIASVTGLWGITFVIRWFASLTNHVWENGFKFKRFSLTSACLPPHCPWSQLRADFAPCSAQTDRTDRWFFSSKWKADGGDRST